MIGELFAYSLVGLVNTAVGLLVIFGSLYFLGTSPIVSNVIGYTIGICLSFVLNGRLTFGRSSLSADMFARFLGVYGFAYAINALCVYLLADSNKYLAEVVGVAIYTAIGFILCRLFVFQTHRSGTP